jgi:hypothetical protein
MEYNTEASENYKLVSKYIPDRYKEDIKKSGINS